MISTEQFLALLEEKELLSARTLASLREQVAQSRTPIPADAIAKRLVKHGRLTASQAKRLLASAEAAPAKDDDLGFAPLDGENEAVEKKAEKPRPKVARKPESRPAPSRPATQPDQPSTSLLDEDISSPAESQESPFNGILSDDSASVASFGNPLGASSPARGSIWQRLFRRKPKIQTEEEKWGSSLMLIGGGALASLVLLGGVLFLALTRGSGDEMFRLADEDYRAGSYAQAIHKYKAYLDKFPNHSQNSVARVRIGLAELRQASQSGSWFSAVEASDDVLVRIAPETDFKEAHGELSSILPEIALRLAAEGRRKPDPATVAKVRHMIELTQKYVPKSLWPKSKLDDVESSLAITQRDIARGDELDKTIAAMEKTAKELKTDDAYSACAALLHQYPDLAADARLKKTLLAVSTTQQGLVKTVSEPKPPIAGQIETAVVRSATLVQRDAISNAPDVEGQIALAAVDGAVYGLDAVTGRVLWRRFVGFDANPRAPSFPPTPFSTEPGADALAVDTSHNELLRIAGATGRTVWRAAIGEPFDANPVVTGDKILVATRGGKLVTVAAASGESPGYVKLPQSLVVAPCVDTRRSLIYQVAAHTNLFILSLVDGACKQVVYLGHDSAGIAAAPAIVDDYLLVAVNAAARESVLHVFAIQQPTEKSPTHLKPVQQISLGGHVQTSPLVEGRRVLVSTNSGVVRVFEVSATDAKTPLRDVAETAVEGGNHGGNNLVRFALLQNGQFWIADNRLTKYDVQAARGRLTPKWIECPDSAFLQPPAALGQTVVSVRRKLGMPGAIVSAFGMEKSEKYWETRLASPLAGEPLVLAASVVPVTANGGVFRIDANQSEPAIVVEPVAVSDPFRIPQPINRVVQLAGGLLAMSGGRGGTQVGVFDPRQPSPTMYWYEMPGKGKLACDPAAFGRGLLAPCLGGQVYWLDPDPRKNGPSLAEPFQPKIEPGAELHWTTPVMIDDAQCVLSDGQTKIYRLGVQEQPKPHLAALAEASIAKPIAAPLAVLGETVFAADSAGALAALKLPALAGGREVAIGGRCAWGPARVGDRVLLATDDNQLHCFDAKGDRVWTAALEHGPLAGAPLRIGDNLLVASRSGIVCRVDAATGKESAKVDVGCPLGAGPVMCGQKLLVGGHDGTIYEVRQP